MILSTSIWDPVSKPPLEGHWGKELQERRGGAQPFEVEWDLQGNQNYRATSTDAMREQATHHGPNLEGKLPPVVLIRCPPATVQKCLQAVAIPVSLQVSTAVLKSLLIIEAGNTQAITRVEVQSKATLYTLGPTW